MRSTSRLLARSLVAFCCFLFLYSAFFSNISIYDYGSQTILSFYIPSYWQEACQFLEIPVSGDEGRFRHENYRIRGISVTFRHGIRSSLASFSNDYGCMPYRETDRQAFARYQTLLASDEFQYFLRLDPKYRGNYTICPETSLCSPGQLTAEGALQHVKLGKFMRTRYSGSNIFAAEAELNVTVITSLYNRTLQSGVAFSSGFFYPFKYRIPQLYIKATEYTSLCASSKCVCNASWAYDIAPFDRTAPADLVQESHSLAEMFDTVLEPRPLVQILDTSLTRYICRRRSLPCSGETCVTYGFLQDAWNYTSLERGTWNYDSVNPNMHRQNVVAGFGVLFHTYQQIQHMRLFPHTNMIKVFSGHDTTVAPLLHVMKIRCLDFPRFAARVVFEIFEDKTDSNKLFLRILLNGDDVTSQARFCPTLKDGLCPTEGLETFVEKEVPRLLGGTTWAAACS